MKRWTMILSVFFAYCLFLVGCANNALPEASTDLSEDAIGGVKIGQNVQEESFVKQYGDKVKLSAIDHEFYDYYVLPDGFEFATEKGGGNITELIVRPNSALATQKGIRVGSSKQDIINAYGQHYAKLDKQGLPIIAYADRERGTYVEFWLYEEKVETIWFGIIKTE